MTTKLNLANELITELALRKIILSVDNGNLKFKAPKNALTSQDRENIANLKSEIIAVLEQYSHLPVHDESSRYTPFNLTDLQFAYMIGRNTVYDYGGVGCHSYLELEIPNLTSGTLQPVWNFLVNRHDMLRAIISNDGTQYVQKDVVIPSIPEVDLSTLSQAEQEQELLQIRNAMSHKIYDIGSWPMFDLKVTKLSDTSILHFSIDLIIADFAGIRILISELGEALKKGVDSLKPLSLSFRDIVTYRKEQVDNPLKKALYQKDLEYWNEQLQTLPLPPELPVIPESAKNNTNVHFSRRHLELEPQLWQQLATNCAKRKLTPSAVVLGCFVEVLARWSQSPSFTINLTLFNRPQELQDASNTVGDFIDVDVLGIRHEEGANFAKRIQNIQEQLWEDMEHKHVTGIDILRRQSKLLGKNIIVPIVYTSTLGIHDERNGQEAFIDTVQTRFGITQTPQVWLDCQTTERNGRLLLDWDIRDEVFPEGLIDDMFDSMQNLLESLANNQNCFEETKVLNLPLETTKTINELNNTSCNYVPKFLHEGFLQNALNKGNNLAVTGIEGTFCYQELACEVFAYVKDLEQLGVIEGERIAVIVPKGVRETAAMLAGLCVGATVVPIEPEQPTQRIASIFKSANISKAFIIDDAEVIAKVPQNTQLIKADGRVLSFTDIKEKISNLLSSLENSRESTKRVAYIIFTSGTTGNPKGVMVSHFAAWNTITAIIDKSGASESDAMLGLASFGFDLSVWDFYGTLSVGAHLVLPEPNKKNDPEHWCALITKYKVTMWNSVPAQLTMLLSWLDWDQNANLDSLRMAFLSGDKIPSVLPDNAKVTLPNLKVISMGGPTETSIWCVWHEITEKTSGKARVTYGKPLSNQEIWILNERLEVCPNYVEGEMYITGNCLADGYCADLAKTNAVFVKLTDNRTYFKSGDIGFYTPDGNIEIIGRRDNQMKINGYRVESGEIEGAILEHQSVKEIVVVPIKDNSAIGALVVLDKNVTPEKIDNTISEIKDSLKAKLPSYMIPECFKCVEALPKSQNRKIDRKQAIAYFNDENNALDNKFESPLNTPVECCLAEIWKELVGRDQISRNDNFFEIGGSSLSAVNLLSKILAHGYPITLEAIFKNSIFKDMSKVIENSQKDEEAWLDKLDLNELADNAMSNLSSATAFNENEPIKNIFITGATGYVGIFLLPILLKNPTTNLCCLVRAKSKEEGLSRIAIAAQKHEVELPSDWQNRVQVFPGVMDQDKFGLNDADYDYLAKNIDSIIHIASIIRLMDPLSTIYPTNVLGVSRIIKLASEHKVKQINYISTIAVHYALQDYPKEQLVPENMNITRWRDIDLTYEKTKIMGENLLYRARYRNVPVNILRPSSITWDSSKTKPFINDDAFVKFFKCCHAMGCYPKSGLSINIVPVNYVAEGIATVVFDRYGYSNNYHICSRKSLQVSEVYGMLKNSGANFEEEEFGTWHQKLHDSFIGGFISLYFKDNLANEEAGHRQYDGTEMNKLLLDKGLEAFSITSDYLGLLTSNMDKIQ